MVVVHVDTGVRNWFPKWSLKLLVKYVAVSRQISRFSFKNPDVSVSILIWFAYYCLLYHRRGGIESRASWRLSGHIGGPPIAPSNYTTQ